MRPSGIPAAAILLVTLVASCGGVSAPTARVAPDPPRPEARVDSTRWGSILWLDVEAIRRLDASAPRDVLLRDVIGADPLMNALIPGGWGSLGALRAIEYRGRRFAGSEWMLLLSLEGEAARFLEEREAAREGAAFRLPGDEGTRALPIAARELYVAKRSLLEEERPRARLRPPFDLEPGMLGAWQVPRAREQEARRRATTPLDLLLVARRAAGGKLIRLEARGRYEDVASARRGREHWERTRRRLAASFAVQLAGLSRPLSEGRLVRVGESIIFRTDFDALELRLVLAIVARLHGRPEAVGTPSPGG